MLPKNITTRTTLPGIRVNTGAAKETSLVVNNRNLGARGDLSQGFGTNSATSREKMQLRHLMAKNNSALYENNPIAQRRMQQQIATKAGELYGIDPKKLMHGGSQTVSPSLSGSNTGLANQHSLRSPATTPSSNAWNTSTRFNLQEKIKVSPSGR